VIVVEAVPPAGGVTCTRSPPYAVVVRHRSDPPLWKVCATVRPAPSNRVVARPGTSVSLATQSLSSSAASL
jgi:hypothetical protein